ncbi:MAG: hypothetical protein WA162_07225 [Thermodesulfobacteriota bacterium]
MIDKECPFYCAEKEGLRFCKASILKRVPEAFEKETFCSSEDYDLCPTFLGYALRAGSLAEHCECA